VLCPQGPLAFQAGPEQVGYGWFPLKSDGPTDPAEVRKGVDALQRFIDEALATYPIDRRKLVILGFSQGGVMAYALALQDPAAYAGLVALSSWLPDQMAESFPANPDLENLQTLVIHGTKDSMISIDRARESRDALAKLGVSASYREYEMGHEINPDALQQLARREGRQPGAGRVMGSCRLKIARAFGIRWFGPMASRAKSREVIPGLSAEQPPV
jgi:predicted esterase